MARASCPCGGVKRRPDEQRSSLPALREPRHLVWSKYLSLSRLTKALALCRGQMSVVLASRLDPGTITVLKGNKPLSLRIHRQHRVVLYASEPAFIDFAVDNETKPQDSGFGRAEGTPEGRTPGKGRVNGWRELEVPPMTMLTIRHEDVRSVENSEFRFIPQERKGTLPEGVNA